MRWAPARLLPTLKAKKVILVKAIFIAVCGAAFAAAAGVASACSRADVDYYLEKGLTREQVAAICGEGPTPGRERDEHAAFLQSAVSAWDVEVTPRHLTYTRKLCLGAGANPEVTARIKICPEVRHRVYFAGLEVHGYQREFVLPGTREIEVTGKVKHRLLHDFDEYPSETRRRLIASYRARTRKDGTVIPIRKDYPMQRVYQILRTYARRASRAAS